MPIEDQERALLIEAVTAAGKAAGKPGEVKTTLPTLKKDDVASYLTFKDAFDRLRRTEEWDDAKSVKMVWRALEGD